MPTGHVPSFEPVDVAGPGKPPRPRVTVGSILIVVGALLAIAGTFLPWANLGNETGTGFDSYRFRDNLNVIEFDSPGVVVLVFAGGIIGLGLALFFAGRVLAVAIISIIVTLIAAIVGLVMIGLMAAVVDDVGGSIGFGVAMTLFGPLVSLAGAITATAKRRR